MCKSFLCSLVVFLLFSFSNRSYSQDTLIREVTDSTEIDTNGFDVEIEDVIFSAKKFGRETKISESSINIESIFKLPRLVGELDVLRIVQMLPGVQNGGDAGSGTYVRGGAVDQNMFLYNGASLYNPTHLMGIFSVFNEDMVNGIKLIKGGFESKYQGRLSSIIDVDMKVGDTVGHHINATLGLLSIGASANGPIIKNKLTYLVSARRTLIDLFTRPMKLGFDYYFWDVNARFDYYVSEKDHLSFSFIMGSDGLEMSPSTDKFEKTQLGWNNISSVLRWERKINPRFKMTTDAIYVGYQYKQLFDIAPTPIDPNKYIMTYISSVSDITLKQDFTYELDQINNFYFGWNATYHIYRPGVTKNGPVGGAYPVLKNRNDATQYAVYFGDDIRVNKYFSLNVGVAGTMYQTGKTLYGDIEPRASMKISLPMDFAIEATGVSMTQYTQIITDPSFGMPTDLWIPSTDKIKPAKGWQASLGVSKMFDYDIFLSVEGYYKESKNVLEYKEGFSFFDTFSDWQGTIEQGRGRSYGLEVFLQRKIGKLTGWIGYTLSWTDRIFENINKGKPFPFRYDNRHDIKVALSYEINPKWSVSATWMYSSGNAFTLAQHQVLIPGIGNNSPPLGQEYLSSGRNNYRMAAYHRLDLGATYKRVKKNHTSIWSFGVFNAYSRQNPFFYYIEKGVLKQYSILPIIPNVSYKVEFNIPSKLKLN